MRLSSCFQARPTYLANRTLVYADTISITPQADRASWNVMKPRIQRVLTHWMSGFMACGQRDDRPSVHVEREQGEAGGHCPLIVPPLVRAGKNLPMLMTMPVVVVHDRFIEMP